MELPPICLLKAPYKVFRYNEIKLCNEVWNGESLEFKNHKVYVLFAKENTEQSSPKMQRIIPSPI